MNALVTFVRIEIWFLLLSFMLVVAYQILIGKINIRGLLFEKNSIGSFSTVRVQLLLFTLIGAVYYILQVSDNPKEFPKDTQELLLILGGSNMVYLGGKSYSLLLRRAGKPSNHIQK